MRWWRRTRTGPPRLPASCADPVGVVLAAAAADPPVSRPPAEDLDLADLRWIVTVEAIDDGGRFNTFVGLSDEVGGYAEVYGDGYELALADQPGIELVEHADREAVLVRSCLSVPDVHAAAIRALLDINRNPREVPEIGLPEAFLAALADGVAAAVAAHGFLPAPDPVVGRRRRTVHQFRRRRDHLIHLVHLTTGISETADGTILDDCVAVTLMALTPGTPETRVASQQWYVPDATPDLLAHRVVSLLPWFERPA
jgi:hypothetical protein